VPIPTPTVLLSAYASREQRSGGGRLDTTVAAGGRRVVFALIRNQSGIVDNYDLTIDGIPEQWWTITPGTVYLVPLGRGEGYEQEVEIALHPPRAPEAQARRWTIHLIATSRSTGQQVAAAGVTLAIEAYHELEAAVSPALGEGRLGARFEAIVTNRANAPAELALTVEDDEQDLGFEPDGRIVTFRAIRASALPFSGALRKRAASLAGRVRAPKLPMQRSPLPRAAGQLVSGTVAQERKRAKEKADERVSKLTGEGSQGPELGPVSMRIAAGDSASVAFVVRPRQQIWIGRRANRRFALRAQEVGEETAGATRSAVFRQRAWLPTWITLVVTLILIAILLLLLLKPKLVKVPDLTQASTKFAAEQVLQKAGLVLSPTVQKKVDATAKSGSIIGQTPAAGARVKKGSTVSILLATRAPHTAVVPSVVGASLADADRTLSGAGFVLGAAMPKPDPKQVVASQIPVAGLRRRRGTPVNVFLHPRPKPKKKPGAGGAGAGAAAGGAAGAAGMVVVPQFAGVRLGDYHRRLAGLSLLASTAYRIDPAPAGTVVAAEPQPGSKVKSGSSVAIQSSAGFPELAYQSGAGVKLVTGFSGATLAGAAIARAAQPAFDPSGARLAFVRGDSIFGTSAAGGADAPVALALAAAGLSYDHPAFATLRRFTLIALIAHEGARDSLCFSRIVASTPTPPSCLEVPGWQLGAVTWGHHGSSVLVAARSSGDPGTFGLLQFFSTARFSSSASTWRTSGQLVTPGSPGRGVLSGVISPDGMRLAAISNLADGTFRAVLVGVRDLAFKQPVALPGSACELAWRSDGEELAVMQADPGCLDKVGSIVGIPPASPRSVTTLALGASDPAWQPVRLGP